MADTKKVNWTKVCDQTEKDCGIPKSTIQEVFNGVNTTITNIVKDEVKGLKDNDVLSIATPTANYVFKKLPERVEKDEKGKEWQCSPAIAVAVAAPQSLLDIANTGFTCTRKALNQSLIVGDEHKLLLTFQK